MENNKVVVLRFLAMVFPCPHISWCKMSSPFRQNNNLVVFPFPFHIYIPLVNFWFIRRQGLWWKNANKPLLLWGVSESKVYLQLKQHHDFIITLPCSQFDMPVNQTPELTRLLFMHQNVINFTSKSCRAHRGLFLEV